MSTWWLAATLAARIIHVSASAPSGGDGSAEKPLKYVDVAVSQAAEKDVIKLAAGTYVMPKTTLKLSAEMMLEGGWDPSFQKRDPIGTPTVLQLAWGQDRPLVELNGSATLDGVTLEGASANSYGRAGMLEPSVSRWPSLVRVNRAVNVKVQNCTLVNSAGHAVSGSIAGALELANNVMLNTRVSAVSVWGVQQGARVVLRRNTIAGVWAEKPAGKRGEGVDIQQHLTATLQGNIISAAQGACVRVGRGNATPVLKGNALGPCARGQVMGWPETGGAVVVSDRAVEEAVWLDAAGNTAGASLGLTENPLAPAPDAGVAPYAPKYTGDPRALRSDGNMGAAGSVL
ncbi:MAG: right-handed parallel beta-helix repeat-containing protein [Myxococcota bacterium]